MNSTWISMDGAETVTTELSMTTAQLITTQQRNKHDDLMVTVRLVYLGFICIAGALGNIMVLAATISNKELRKPGNMFIINLGVVDLVTNLMSIPVVMVSLSYGEWIFSDGMCRATAYIGLICLAQSVESLAHIAGARYLLITKPRRVYQRYCSWLPVCIYILLIWCSTILLAIMPEFGLGEIAYNPVVGFCTISPEDPNSWIYTTILVSYSILTTLVFIPCFYFLTCYKVMASRRRVQQRNAFHRNTSRIEENLNFWKREIGLSKVLIVTLLAYIICWLPYAVVHFISFERPVSESAQRASVLLLLTNSCVNPYIYAVLNRKFRQAYKGLFLGFWYKVHPPSSTGSNSAQTRESNNDHANAVAVIFQRGNAKSAATSSHDNPAFHETSTEV